MIHPKSRFTLRRAGLVAVAGAALACSSVAFALGSWSNWFQTQSVTPLVMAAPGSAGQLVSYVKQASAAGLRIRMVGHGHSMSDVAINKEILLTPDSLNKPLSVDTSRLNAGVPAGLMRVQSGIQVSSLNTWLDQNGRALFNMGGYDGQTLAGVMMTATHGSGLNYGPIADSVVSLQMVVDGGRMVQLEPSHGVTNPATFPGTLEEDRTIPVQLIQDDDAFNAARVSIGSMGIVYSITLATDRKFWLKEVETETKWSTFKQPGGPLDNALHGRPIYGNAKPSPEHWEFQYDPYPDANGDHTVLITDRYVSYTPLPEQSDLARGKPGASIGESLVALFGTPLAGIMDLFPTLAPTVVQSALDTEVEGSWTNVSYKVFNIGVANYTPAYGIEAAFTLDQITAAVEQSFATNAALYAKRIPQTGPIAVRLVKASSGLIAMQQGRDTAFIEIIDLRTSTAQQLLRTHQQTFLNNFNSRPHWGLDTNLLTSQSQLAALYPDTWGRWLTQYRRFNVTGTFDGAVTDRLGISVRPR